MNKINENKDALEMPKTKIQKLKLKHKNLFLIIGLLIIVLIVLFLLSNNKSNKNNKPNNNNNAINTTNKTNEKEEQKQEEPKDLKVYDVNSNTRPYAVMIPNDGTAKKRQYGINKAYLIYEITVEGGITRLLALFKDVDVDKIGPVRSSRHYYLDYALENDAIYIHFGWSPQAQSDISTLGINNLNGLYNPSNMFSRDKNYSSPNNAFTSTEKIKKAAEKKDYSLNSTNYQLLNYEKNVDLSTDDTLIAANKVKVNYAGNAYVNYIYDETNKYYLRYNNKNKHIDNATNEQVHMKNILVLKMDTVNIENDDKGRQNLNNIGKGEGYYITEGNAIKITWNKDSRTSKTIYKDTKGNKLKVNDGNTFIQIQPTNKSLEIE